jgi:hypothetical protein
MRCQLRLNSTSTRERQPLNRVKSAAIEARRLSRAPLNPAKQLQGNRGQGSNKSSCQTQTISKDTRCQTAKNFVTSGGRTIPQNEKGADETLPPSV